MYRPAAISRHLQCTAHFRQAYNPFSSLCSFPSFQVEPVQKSWHAQAIQAGKLVSFSLKFTALSRCLECVAGKLRKLGMICWKAQNGPKKNKYLLNATIIRNKENSFQQPTSMPFG